MLEFAWLTDIFQYGICVVFLAISVQDQLEGLRHLLKKLLGSRPDLTEHP